MEMDKKDSNFMIKKGRKFLTKYKKKKQVRNNQCKVWPYK
jgi:hypothetical protein